jgi:outer membrane lipoprotein SlyB
MRSLRRIIAWFFYGCIAGAILGALGGLFDRGSMFIMVPSGSLVWAIFGAFAGGIAGAIAGVFWSLYLKIGLPSNLDKRKDNNRASNQTDDHRRID